MSNRWGFLKISNPTCFSFAIITCAVHQPGPRAVPNVTLETPHFTLCTSLWTLHTARFTLHTSSHLISSELFSVPLSSSLLICHQILWNYVHLIWSLLHLSHLIDALLNSSQLVYTSLSFYCQSEALILLYSQTVASRKLLHRETINADTFTQKFLYPLLTAFYS